MKKTSIFLAVAAGIAVIACSKEAELPVNETIVEEPEVAGQTTEPASVGVFKASIGEEATKVTLDAADGYKLKWVADDPVAVYKSGQTEYSLYRAASAGVSTDLTGAELEGAATYYAVYPEGAAVSFDGTLKVKIAPEQALTAGGIADNVIVAKTTGAEASFNFKNLGSLIQFTLDGAKNVEKVVIGAVGGENVAGTVSVDLSGDAPSYTVVSGSKTITLTPAGGSTFASGTYYAAILPQTYSAGLCLKLFDNEGKEVVLEQSSSQTITRSRRLPLGSIDDVKAFAMNRTISDAAEFVNFLSHADAETWTLAGDIDLAGISIPFATDFTGTLDGGSHTVENLTVRGPLFGTLAGTVQDLTIGNGSSLTFSHIAGSYGYVAGTNSGTIDGVTVNGNIAADTDAFASPETSTYVDMCVGALAGTNTGIITNCTNNASFTITSDVSKYTPAYLGGIAGKQATSTALKGCVNAGNISLDTPSRSGSHISANCFVGGIVGGTPYGESTGAALGGCTNSGAIKVVARDGSTSLPKIKLGGIAGYIDGTIDNCNNSGSVTHTNPTETVAGSSFRNCTIGGVAGTVTGAISGCDNTGNVTASGSFCYSKAGTATQTFFGGVTGYAGSSVTRCTNNKPLSVTAIMNSTSTSATHNGYFGGIAGYVAAATDGCTNSGALNISTTFNTSWVGGIAGYTLDGTLGDTALCSNSGAIDFDFVNTAASGNQAVKAFIGGLVGQHAGTDKVIKANATSSRGNITVSNGYYSSGNYTDVGGIAGQSNGAVNGTEASAAGRATYSGTITVNSNIQVRIGGIAAETAKTLLNVCFSGKINVPDLGTKSCVGGFTGVRSGSNMGGSTLTGTVTCAYSGEQNTTNNVRVGLCHGIVTAAMTTHSTTIGAAAKLTATGGMYAGIFAGSASNVLTMGNASNAFTYRPGATYNETAVATVSNLTDSFLVGRLYDSGAITRTNLKVE